MKNQNKAEILLESGTNELEIMEFTIAGELFGINVAKVREIMKISSVKPMPNSHSVIEGIIKPRDTVITVLNLAKYLNLPESTDRDRDIFIVTNFNNLNFAFHVHSVVGIDRISWKNIQKPDNIIYGGKEGVATGIAEYEKRLITILDFEKIVAEISPEDGIKVADIDKLGQRSRNDMPILIAEDSMLLSKMIIQSLHKAGYVNIIKTENGQEAYDFLQEAKNEGNPLSDHVICVVTDIEMPQMDGYHLTKLVKDDSVLKQLPVILFSSIVNDEVKSKGLQVGADAQISKPQIASLVSVIDSLISK